MTTSRQSPEYRRIIPSQAINRELLAALKETRDAAAALLRAILAAGVTDQVVDHMSPQYDGFGKRANEAIAKAERSTI